MFRGSSVESVKVSELGTVEIKSLEESITRQVELGESVVTFVVELDVPLSAIPYIPNKEVSQQPLIINEQIEESVLPTEIEADALSSSNEENI